MTWETVGVGVGVAVGGGEGRGRVAVARALVAAVAVAPAGTPAKCGGGVAPATLAARTAVTNATNKPTHRPLSLMGTMALGEDPLAEVFLLEWHQVGGGEFLYQFEKV